MAAKAKPKGMVGKHRWVVFGVVAAVAVLGYLWWRQRQSAQAAPQPPDASQAPWWSTEGSTGGAGGGSGDGSGLIPIGTGSSGGGGSSAAGGGGGSSYPTAPTYSTTTETAQIAYAQQLFQQPRNNTYANIIKPGKGAASTYANMVKPRLAPEAPKYANSFDSGSPVSETPQPQYQQQVPVVVGGGGKLVG